MIGLTPGLIAIKWLLPERVTACVQVNYLCIITNTKINSAFHPVCLAGVKTGSVFTGQCVKWPVTLRSHMVGDALYLCFPQRATRNL